MDRFPWSVALAISETGVIYRVDVNRRVETEGWEMGLAQSSEWQCAGHIDLLALNS